MSAVTRGEREGGVDASHGALGEGDADVERMRRDEVGGGIEPDVAIDGALGVDETVDEGDERSADIVAVCGEDRVASDAALTPWAAACSSASAFSLGV